jgi:hypothetical protein
MRTVNGEGGIQTFLRRLQRQARPATGEVRLEDQDLDDLPHYAFDYGQGGFENRLVNAFGRVLGRRLGREDPPAEPPT